MKEFVDFLGDQAPYDALDDDDLARLAATVEAEYFAAGAVLVRAGAAALAHLGVLRAGAVDVLDGDRRVDQLRVGDTYGHVSLFSGAAPTLSVVAARDTLVYRLADPRGLLRHPERLRFTPYGLAVRPPGTAAPPGRSLQPASAFARDPVVVTADTPVRRVAALVGAHRQSCAVVRSADGLGIVTDADFRARVASGAVGVDEPVEAITSRPALTVPRETPAAAALTEMVRHGVHHLVLTGPQGEPTGVVRVVDLASAEVRDPLALRATVAAAADLDDLAAAVRLLDPTTVELAEDGVRPAQVVALRSAVVDAALARLFELAGPPGVRWLVTGAPGRRDAVPGAAPEVLGLLRPGSDRAAADQDPAAVLTRGLEVAGLRPATGPGPVLDDDPGWRRRLAGAAARGTPSDLALLGAAVDARPVGADAEDRSWPDGAARALHEPVVVELLRRHAVRWRPPTGFVADEVVLAGGDHAADLDLAGLALGPLAALGRWAAVATADRAGPTPDRLRRAADDGLLSLAEAAALVGAHDHVVALLLAGAVAALRDGRPVPERVAVTDLDDAARRDLREAFRAVAMVQQRLAGDGGD